MGISFSCPLVDDLDSRVESYLVRSISLVGDDAKTALRSISFNGLDSEFGIMKSVAFKTPSTEVEENVPLTPVTNDSAQNCDELPREESTTENNPHMQSPRADNLMHLAALKLQKTYKSFRIRRQLADCAVLVEQRWWKILDFAELKCSSISFFEVEKPQTAISRWSRARTRAAKVGKGLSKDEKARKLALQHWLEAIDPRHRYGHNLQFYYLKWLHCESRQPFFYWLDVGEGREVTVDRCPRLKLQQQCIKYLGPMERKDYEVTVVDGNFRYKQSGKLLDTREGPEDAKWIFVLSVSRILYVGMKKKGTFQHSSFLAGGATLSAGRLVVEDGILKAVWPHSGHYLPTAENFEALMSFLLEHNVDLSNVQRSPGDDTEEVTFVKKESSLNRHTSKSEPDLGRMAEENNTKASENSQKQYCKDAENIPTTLSRRTQRFNLALKTLEIPKRQDLIEMFLKQEQLPRHRYIPSPLYATSSSEEDGYETAEEFLSDEEFMMAKSNLYDEDEEEEYEEPVPKDKIIQRINSHKGMNSYQFAQQQTCKWSTGAGPRIGCMRDYPSELQFRVLEEVSLSPRSSAYSPRRSFMYNSRFMNSTNLARSPLGRDSKEST